MADPYDYTQSTYKAPTGALSEWANDPSKLTADVTNGMAGDMKSATPYQPSDNALVSKNLTKLLSADNPYITSARTRAASYSNSRGLLNSSIGAGAGESAAIDASLPIAQGDTANYFTAERDNNQNTNAFALDSNRFQREGALSAVRAGFDRASQERGLEATAAESAAARGQRGQETAADLAMRDKTLAADVSLRGRGYDIQEGELGVRQGDLALKRDSLTADNQFRAADQLIKQADLDRMTAADRTQAEQKNAVLLQEMQRTYMDARTQLETTPNLDTKAKANAINAMNQWFVSTALPNLRASLGYPTMWPDTPYVPKDTDVPRPGVVSPTSGGAAAGYVDPSSTLAPKTTNNNATVAEMFQAIQDERLRRDIEAGIIYQP